MKKIITVFLFFFILSLMPTIIFAAKKSGYAKIAELQGEVSMKRCGGDRTFKAVKGMKLVEGDTLYTAAKSSASVIFDNNSQVVIGENSAVNLAEMRNLESKKSSTIICLKKGSIFSKVKKKLTQKEKFQIRTSNAIAGVRGTEFYVNTVDGNTYVYVLKGKVELSSYYSDKKLMTQTGQLSGTDETKPPYLIENNRETILNHLKEGFYGSYEEQDYSYEQGKTEVLVEKEQLSVDNNDISVRYDSESETEPNPDVKPPKRVLWNDSSMAPYELKVNGTILNDRQNSGTIHYVDKIEIKVNCEHPTSPSQYLFHKKAKLQTDDGRSYEKPLVVNSAGTYGEVVILMSEFDLSSAEYITIEIND